MATVTNTTQASHYKTTGDVVNVCVLAASLAYAATVVYYTQPGVTGVVDEHWKKDGFCIQNMDVPYWSSFDTCLYVDVVFSAVLGIMYLSWKEIPGMEVVSEMTPGMIVGTLGHGLAHGAQAATFRDGSYQTSAAEEEPVWFYFLFGAFFWFPFLKIGLKKVKTEYVALLSLIVTVAQIPVKKELGFAYVQTILYIVFGLDQLMMSPERKNKREYTTFALVSIPPVVVSWNEALLCDAYFRSVGGHVLYDGVIIVSLVMQYIDCYLYHTRNNSKSLVKEKDL
eukprot:CAMPEP_0201125502 /NCGR_PEP_ID=MMETSP0850-20130426/21697_1 /ASSEMBLY_ACC=CAM_ASM_000622 /TAXON_ID=183588 /ORGANISM="Pseudo-nitzschia fraudulenta, Strain WWA7" /LENGTH=281 /DNA_ID=CAMNT_0047393551 /DNA_START=82 /DNA_END=927 /DNA_ORIENTATION=-